MEYLAYFHPHNFKSQADSNLEGLMSGVMSPESMVEGQTVFFMNNIFSRVPGKGFGTNDCVPLLSKPCLKETVHLPQHVILSEIAVL